MKNAGKNLWQSRKLITKLKYILLNEQQQQQQQRANEKKVHKRFSIRISWKCVLFSLFFCFFGGKKWKLFQRVALNRKREKPYQK